MPAAVHADNASLLAVTPFARSAGAERGSSWLRCWQGVRGFVSPAAVGAAISAGGKRPLTARPPAVPAAAPPYSVAGDTRCLVVDASRDGAAAVTRDCAEVTELVRQAGGRGLIDESPSSGQHLNWPAA